LDIVPGHSGIWQNELADKNAKAASSDLEIVNLNWDIIATSSFSRTFIAEQRMCHHRSSSQKNFSADQIDPLQSSAVLALR